MFPQLRVNLVLQARVDLDAPRQGLGLVGKQERRTHHGFTKLREQHAWHDMVRDSHADGTSFLVLESDADRERFAVKRRFQMRDGEKFFAEGRDNATYELKQQQMKKAGEWRTGLRLPELRAHRSLWQWRWRDVRSE